MAVVLPGEITVDWVLGELKNALLSSTERNPKELPDVLPAATVVALLDQGAKLLKAEPTLLEIEPSSAEDEFCVFGDTHGQFHDVCHMVTQVVGPSRRLVFNGDYVDRGAWGLETLVLLVALKVAAPQRFFLLRGNHETRSCTHMYGFDGELQAKYGRAALDVAKSCRRVFGALPLAACIASATLVLHGGLFRGPKPATPPAKRARTKLRQGSHGAEEVLTVGTLQHLKAAGKGGIDPDGERPAVLVASDVLWSDPGPDPGMRLNMARGIGLVFGPDITQEFMAANGLKLIIRSHEGPDARQHRADMPPVQQGFSFDHTVRAGRLMTVFSAPDYPQFQVAGPRTNNQAAVATLSAPGYCTPTMLQFSACPRPKAEPYYNFDDTPGSDEDMGFLSSPTHSPSAGSPPPPPASPTS